MAKPIRRTARRTASALRDLLYPPRCIACGDLLEPFTGNAAVFCPLCRTAWETAVTEAAEHSARDAARGLVYLAFYRSGQTDGIPERLIYHVKHHGDPRTLRFVAERLAPRVLQAAATLPARIPATRDGGDMPILFTYPPRRRSAVSQDGFDQAARLSKALAAACGGEHATLIRRTRRPSSEQKQLDAEARGDNAIRSYELAKRAAETVRGRTVAVCDDLCTTGATLNRCAELLVEAGAGLVILVTVERTQTNESGSLKKHCEVNELC